MRKLLVVLIFAFIIPQGISFRTWLNMFPELEAVAKCESGFNSQAIGDHGKSIGLFQIYLPSHPTITKKQALDPYWSLAWAINRYYAGELNIWVCHRILTKNTGRILNL